MLLKTRSRSLTHKKKHAKTPEEARHLAKVAAIGCILCSSPACCHHIRYGQGMGQKASHFETIPLCHFHHQGKEGIHTLGTRAWEAKYGKETDLLETVKHLVKE